jgi:RHS repeat-associated protein
MLGGERSTATNLLYTGEQWDSAAQMYNLRARYYNPSNGLFNRTDPHLGNYQDPQSLHKYLYCHANPLNNIDPTGRQIGGSYSLTEVLAISAIGAVLAGMVTYNVTGSVKAAAIVGASVFVLTFIGLGGIGLVKTALTGGVVSSPHLLNPNSWQEAESMLGQVLQLPKNTFTSFYEGMTRGARPDFIDYGRKYIAECKWVEELYMSDQLRNYGILAKIWDYQLYIYVRSNTHVSSGVIEFAEETNSVIIRIFE